MLAEEDEMDRRGRRARLGVLMLVFVLVAAACSDDDGSSDATDATDAPSTTAAAASTIDSDRFLACDVEPTAEEVVAYELPTANEAYDITLMQVSLAGYYYQAIDYGAHSSGEEAGVEVTTLAAEGYASPELQLQQVEDAIQRGTDAIVFAPSDIAGSVPAVEKALEAGIPVVNISTEVAQSDVYMVMQDDYLLGIQLADELAVVLGPEGGGGIMIAGPANATWSLNRTDGFSDRVAEAYPNIEILAAPTQLVDPVEGLASFDDAVQAHPDIDWITSVHYFILQPESLSEEYKSVPHVSYGYEPDSINALEGGGLVSVFGTNPVAMGRIGVGTAISLLNGDEQPRINCLPGPSLTVVDRGTPVAENEVIEGDG
jgi:ABC-type sugar transport system substrate-binding protein